jgi:8-oxo-dGTP diphosphatase
LAIWEVTAWAGSVTNFAPEEHDELRWFDADEWSALFLAHHEYRNVLALAMAAVIGG